MVQAQYPSNSFDSSSATGNSSLPPEAHPSHGHHRPYAEYPCQQGDPLYCTAFETLAPLGSGDRRCPYIRPQSEGQRSRKCHFPTPIPIGKVLRGRRGEYQILAWRGTRGSARLYQAIDSTSGETIAIKEYVLPARYFEAREEVRQIQQRFLNLGGLTLADGRTPDLRLVAPDDVLVESPPKPETDEDKAQRSCFAVSSSLNLSPTLREYLDEGNSLTPVQVRMLLYQVLQTLEYLHEQKFRLPSGQVREHIVCGNLSLDTLLWVDRVEDVFIYICDLAMWERIFSPLRMMADRHQPADDLKALGQLAYEILTQIPPPSQAKTAEDELPENLPGNILGMIATEVTNTRSAVAAQQDAMAVAEDEEAAGRKAPVQQPELTADEIEEEKLRRWGLVPLPLKSYIERLMEYQEPFASAAEAREQLPPLTALEAGRTEDADAEREEARPRWVFYLLLLLIGVLGTGLLAWVIWFLITWLRPDKEATELSAPLVSSWEEVSSVPPGQFRYTAIAEGSWDRVRFVAQAQGEGDEDLEGQLRSAAQEELFLQYQPSESWQDAVDAVAQGELDFAVVPLVGDLPLNLRAQPIAFDGMAVLVAFSTARRRNSMPTALNGRLTFDQLQLMFGGRVNNWRNLDGPDFQIQLYLPRSAEWLYVFEELGLGGIEVRQGIGVQRVGPYVMMREILRDFEEDNIGGLGVLPFSIVFNQCSVFPLAVGETPRRSVQALVMRNGRDVGPQTNLCDEKGNFFLNPERFEAGEGDRNWYPLAYPIGVVYPQDNSLPQIGPKMVELFETQEGQELLRSTGLLPLDSDAFRE